MSTYRKPNVNGEPPQLSDMGFNGDIRFDPNDNAPNYIGLNVTNGADTASTDWKILKFTYNSTYTTRIQTAYGSWDGRVALF